MNRWEHTDAFVIRLCPETNIGAGHFEGRVEHVASCRTAEFESVEELVSFFEFILVETHAKYKPQ